MLVHDEFEITDLDRPAVRAMIQCVDASIRDNGQERRNIILAALAELSAQYLNSGTETKSDTPTRRNRTIS